MTFNIGNEDEEDIYGNSTFLSFDMSFNSIFPPTTTVLSGSLLTLPLSDLQEKQGKLSYDKHAAGFDADDSSLFSEEDDYSVVARQEEVLSGRNNNNSTTTNNSEIPSMFEEEDFSVFRRYVVDLKNYGKDPEKGFSPIPKEKKVVTKEIKAAMTPRQEERRRRRRRSSCILTRAERKRMEEEEEEGEKNNGEKEGKRDVDVENEERAVTGMKRKRNCSIEKILEVSTDSEEEDANYTPEKKKRKRRAYKKRGRKRGKKNSTATKRKKKKKNSQRDVEDLRRKKANKRTFFLNSFGVKILEEWFVDHSDNPYPKKHEKSFLVEQTGFTLVQVCNWFSNVRKRKWLILKKVLKKEYVKDQKKQIDAIKSTEFGQNLYTAMFRKKK